MEPITFVLNNVNPAPAETTVFVTGAAGFIGSHIVTQLLEEGFSVVACVRNPKGPESRFLQLLDKKALTIVRADLVEDSVEYWRGLIQKHRCDCLIHTARMTLLSPFSRTAKTPDEFMLPAVEGTKKIVEAIEDLDMRRVIFTSSFAAVVFGHDLEFDPRPFTEDDWNSTSSVDSDDPMHWYRASKVQAERELWKSKHKKTTAAINPPMVIGPWVDNYNRLNESSKIILDKLLGNETEVAPGGVGWVDVRDVAKAHILALKNLTVNGRFLIASECLSHYEFNLKLKQMYPKSEPAVCNPVWMVDTRKALMDLDMVNYFSLEEAIESQVESLIRCGYIQEGDIK